MSVHWIPPEMMQRLAGSLLHFVWQGAIVALFTALVLRFLARRSPDTRYTVAVLGLLLMVVAPMATFVFYAQTGALTLKLLKLAGEFVAAASSQQPAQPADALGWTRWIVAVWFTGVALCSLRLVAGWRLSRRLKQTADALAPQRVVDIFERIRERLMTARPVHLLMSTRIDTPAVIGWIRPAILLPVTAITGLTDEQLMAVFAHELAHIRRHDFLVNVLQRGIEAVLFYHPAVWWLSARIRAERENCCDDLAVQVCGDRLLYAEALIELERSRDTAVPSMAVAATGDGLVYRVRRILGRETASQDWQSAVVALLFVVAWIVGGVWQSETAQAVPVRSAGLVPSSLALLPPSSAAAQSIAAIITAQPVPAPEPEPIVVSQSSAGTIEGVVVRAGSSQPVANAQVTLSGSAFSFDGFQSWANALYNKTATPPPDVIRNATTRIQDHLQSVVGLSGQALADAAKKATTEGLPASPANAVLEDRLLEGAIQVGKNFGMSPYNPDFSAMLRGYRNQAATFKTVTDRSGRFTLINIPQGQYTVRAERNGYFGAPGSIVPQTAAANVTLSGPAANVTVSMIPAATISGRLRDDAGLPMANASVQAFSVFYSAGGAQLLQAAASGKTDDRGMYSLFWLPAGEYFVAWTHATTSAVGNNSALQQVVGAYYPGTTNVTDAIPVAVKAGENIEGLDFTSRAPRPVKVSGTVRTDVPLSITPAQALQTGRGGTAGGNRIAVLMLLARDATAPDDAGARQVGVVNLGSDGMSGTFEIAVAPGSYELFARMPVQNSALGNTFGRISIDPRDEDIKNVELQIHATVAGQGTFSVNGAAPGQSNIRVTLRADDAASRLPAYAVALVQRITPVAADGTFNFPGLYVGHYAVVVEGLTQGMYVSDVRHGASTIFDSGIDIGAQPPNPFQVFIKTDSGTVQGLVQDNGKKPVAGVTVVVMPPENRRQNRMLYFTAKTDASGRFTVQGVAPGNYKVFAWSDLPAGVHFNPKFVSKYEAAGRAIAVGTSSTVSVDLTAIPLY